MPHRHVAMVLYEPAGSRRWWRRKGAGRCPLPRLFRRCVGRGLAATVEVVAAAAMVIFPSRRGLLRIPGLGVHREIPLERCGPLGGGAAARPHVRGATGVGTATSTVRCPFGASLGVQASEVLLEAPTEVPGPFPTLTSTGRSAEDLGVPRGAAATASAGGYRTRVQDAAGRKWVEPWIHQGSPRTEKSEPIALRAPAPIGFPRWGPSGCRSHEVCPLVLPPPVKPMFQPAWQILYADLSAFLPNG